MQQNQSRRDFIKIAAGFATGAAVATPVTIAYLDSKETNDVNDVINVHDVKGVKGATSIYNYEHKIVGSFKELQEKKQLDFSYPDANSPCKAILTSDGKVEAYSTLCTHKGCPTVYDVSKKVFVCPCHFSKFDAEKKGQLVIGQATAKLPRILVEVKDDDIIAYGTDGLIFGRLSNNI